MEERPTTAASSSTGQPETGRPYLDGLKFDGETTRQMGIAFQMALASLGATRGCDDPIRAALAQRIIALAHAGERDPERLCDSALRAAPKPPKTGAIRVIHNYGTGPSRL
jgi:hypothetical protein